ncbi:MAG: dUTP diphosphatase [Erysipelotrichaceae bacterium]|nr:dUTP diphosphatase [Erysipelotrichaceae bacterium]
MQVKIKRINEKAIVPTRGSLQAAGYDLYSPIETTIHPHETVKIPTGWMMAVPEGYFGGVFARSGLATREGLRPANCVGVIDSDYRGEVIVALHNDSDEERYIEPGERIAQLILVPVPPVELQETDELDETERNTGGFGSTGKL